MTAAQYVEDFLYHYFKPNTVIVGYDHHFGKGRNGNIELLKTMGARLHFQVEEINEQLVQNEIISSTLIRNYIAEHEIKKANDLLGYAYQFEGFVVRGNQLGRTIGYPTANLHINDEEKLIPANGVYAVKVKGACTNHAILDGMMNIGIRPTVDGQKKVIEVLDFSYNRTDAKIAVTKYKDLTPEEKQKQIDGVNFIYAERNDRIHTASQLLRAYTLYDKDQEYVINAQKKAEDKKLKDLKPKSAKV